MISIVVTRYSILIFLGFPVSHIHGVVLGSERATDDCVTPGQRGVCASWCMHELMGCGVHSRHGDNTTKDGCYSAVVGRAVPFVRSTLGNAKGQRVRTVDQLRAVVHDPLNGPLLLEMPDSYPGKTAVDLQPLNQDRLRDELEGRNFFQDTVVDDLVEDDGVDCLVLDLSFGPLLLLCRFAAARGSGLGRGFGGLQDENCQSSRGK